MYRPTEQLGVGSVTISKKARKYINQVLDSTRLTYGPFSELFERKMARAHHKKYAFFCNSGTSALQVALHALKKKNGWKDGDEVIVPALTFVATVNIVLQNNLTPVFVDVTPEYFDIDPKKIEGAITKKTRALIPVHIGGQSADMIPIMKIARKYKLKVIEDSCETMFAKYHKRPVGSWGDFACFSTYAAHTLVTGVGGRIATNDPELAITAKSLLNHGRDGIYIAIDDDQVKNEKKLFDIVDRRFNFIDVGYSYRATEFEAALGVAQFEERRKILTRRKENAAYLSAGLADLSKHLQLPHIREKAEHIFMFYPLIIKDPKVKRADLIHFLEKNLIETRFLLPLLNQPVYTQLWGNIENRFPIAKNIAHNGFYVGSHPGLIKRDLDYIIAKFHEFFSLRNI